MKLTTYNEINDHNGFPGQWEERTLDQELIDHLNTDGNAVNLETEDLKVCGIWKENGRYWLQWLPITEENDAKNTSSEIFNFSTLEEVFYLPHLLGEIW
jgi:hypothetical protein